LKLETSDFITDTKSSEYYRKTAKLGRKGSPDEEELLKLETSSLTKRWTAESTNEKCKIMSKGVM